MKLVIEKNYRFKTNELYGFEFENGEADNDDLIDLIIPDGVEIISANAFEGCAKISSVVIPSSVRKIEYAAFYNCENLFSVTIQEGLEEIRYEAFYGCKNLRTINIPDSVRQIGKAAFGGCDSLESFKIGKQRELLGSDVFGRFPERLKSSLIDLLPYIYDSAKYDYIRLLDEESLRKYGIDKVMSIVLEEMEDVFFLYWNTGREDWDTAKFAKVIAKRIRKNGSNRTCLIAANYIAMHYKRIDADSLRTIYSAIKSANHSDAAVRIIESDKKLMAKMGYDAIGMQYNPLEHLVLEETADYFKFTKSDDGHRPPFEILQNMISWIVSFMYQIPLDKMHFPQLKDINGNVVIEFVIEWLMVENEDFLRSYDKRANVYISHFSRFRPSDKYFKETILRKESSLQGGWLEFAKWEVRERSYPAHTQAVDSFRIQSGYNKSTEKILQLIDGDSLQEALLQIAKEYVKGEVSDHDKLAIPISRFANEKTFMEVSKKLRGKLASACVVNRTRAGLDFAYHHGYIKEYAAAMGLGEGTVCSMVYFDIDLDANGYKTYDLGNQSVKAVFQPADALMIEMPNGKLLKSFPKASSDNELYLCAKKDFAKLKKACQDAYDNYEYGIYKSFLSGCEWRVEWWEEAFHSNYIINYLARWVVWEQGGKTFMMKENGYVDSSLLPYSLSKEPIKVAHPMEMSGNEIRYWRTYLTINGMDAWQMSEPIVNMDNVREDRYAGIQLELSNYFDLDRDGIYVTYPLQSDRAGWVYYELALEDVHVQSAPVMSTDEIDGNDEVIIDVTENDKIELYSIEIENPSRYANHVIATLDKIVVNEWIMKENASIFDSLQEFTSPQITKFAKFAQDVLAILLDYIDKSQDDYDPMGEFELS